MVLNFKKSRSNSVPKLIDTTSSKNYVYIRDNVEILEEECPMDPERHSIVYQYDEAILTKEEYQLYLESAAAEENNLESQLALAELAESMDANNTAVEQALAELAELIVPAE